MTVLLKHPSVGAWRGTYPASEVTECLRVAVEERRRMILQRGPGAPDTAEGTLQAVVERAGELLSAMTAPRVTRAINATGILLHTGLGRAVFASTVVDDLLPELKGCCTLAVNRATGDRAERDELLEPLLARLTGAEAGTVVNNNAAATLLILNTLCNGREAVVSRGQLVEIGGSYRLPEVMARSGAILREVGTTNRTRLSDYAVAINERTALLVRVHTSNYRQSGFVESVGIAELAALGRERNVLVYDDLGSGALFDLRALGLPPEPTAADSVRAGADVVSFSGDKLLGGPQAGLILGRANVIRRLAANPLMRTYRPDKLTFAALEATLRLHRDPQLAAAELPTMKMLTCSAGELAARAARLAEMLAAVLPGESLEAGQDVSFAGAGSLPTEALPTWVVRWRPIGRSADDLHAQLRGADPPVVARVRDDALILDLRTLSDADCQALVAVAGSLPPPSLPTAR